MMLPSVALAAAAGCQHGSSEWVDLDTPSDACATTGVGGKPFTLVFSDEFELPGRSLKDGDDARWTGMDSRPGGNAQVSYYNASLPTTHEGSLHLPVVRHFVPARKNAKGVALEGTEKYYQTGMVQTWNKFCFSRSGIVEMKARLPGKATMPGLWPAFWIMGNLGRATLEASTDGIWPFSYDACVEDSDPDCEAAQCHAQRISACDEYPGHGLNPRQGRGSPEVDIVEAIPGSEKTTGAHNVFECFVNHDHLEKTARLKAESKKQMKDKDLLGYLQMPRPQLIGSYQVAPGLPLGALERPKDACMPMEDEWYAWNFSKTEQRFWYDGASPPDPGVVVMPTYSFWGSKLTKEPAKTLPTVQGWKGGGDHPFWMQTDSLSASTPLTVQQWEEMHVYSIEWRSTETGDGYMRWMLDGAMYFELPESLLSTPRVMHRDGSKNFTAAGDVMGSTRGRMLPREPMYIILNVDMSPNWGWPEWYRCNLGECDCCMDCSDPKCTTCMVYSSFKTPRGDFRYPSSAEHPKVEVNGFEWFADMCGKIPSMDETPGLTVDTGLLDLSYQIDHVRVYQPDEDIDLGCDPEGFPTAQWIDDHAEDFTPPDMEKPIKSVVPGGGACTANADCGGAVTPGVAIPRGSCVRVQSGAGTCECAEGWVGPHCLSQSAGVAAACSSFELLHMRAEAEGTIKCQPPPAYNRTMLQHVIDAFCTRTGRIDSDDPHLLDGTNTAQIAIHKACAEVDTRGSLYFSCSEAAKAALLTTALADASGRCCNVVQFGTDWQGMGTRSLMCRGVNEPISPPPPSPPPPSPNPAPPPPAWVTIGGGAAAIAALAGIGMYAKRRLDGQRELVPAGDYQSFPGSNEGL